MSSFSTQDVAQSLGITVTRVRSYVRSGVLTPSRGPSGEYRFSFQDVVTVRTAEALQSSAIPARRVHQAFKNLRRQLPEGCPLSAVRLETDGDEIVASDDDVLWEPESGQLQFDFSRPALAGRAATSAPAAPVAVLDAEPAARDSSAASFGVAATSGEPDTAEPPGAQERAVDSQDADVHVTLGLALHEAGSLVEAEWHYRQALVAAPQDATAAFNLGVVLEDLDRTPEAVDAYAHALRIDPRHADAHFNISRLYEQAGDRVAAFRHLAQYKRLVDPDR